MVGDIGKFIYFSPALDSHGPRIKFYGGTKETSTTRNAPSYSFGKSGAESVILQPWMNKKNCPNGYESSYISKVETFINKFLPILLLVWFEHLDESPALLYLQGHLSFDTLLNRIEVEDEVKSEILNCQSIQDLDVICRRYKLYQF